MKRMEGNERVGRDPHIDDNMERERLYAGESFLCRACGNEGEVGADLAAAITVNTGFGNTHTDRTWVHKTCRAKAWQPVDFPQLGTLLDTYVKECEESGLSRSTIDTYENGASQFVRWLRGDFRPGSGLDT